MPVTEQFQAIGEWSVRLRPDTPLALREKLWRHWAHVIITNAWVDPTVMSDSAMLAAARYSGIVLRPASGQLEISGPGLAWWLGDADDNPQFIFGTLVNDSYAHAYDLAVHNIFIDGQYGTGGNLNGPARIASRRHEIDVLTRYAGHEWRVNPDFTFDADTRANLFGTTPTVVLIDGGGGRDLGLVGLDADIQATLDYEQWTTELVVESEFGTGSDLSDNGPVSRTPFGYQAHSRPIRVAAPDLPYLSGILDAYAAKLNEIFQRPRREITAKVRDRSLVEHVNCGDLVYVYDELEDVRDLNNQVWYGGRTIWPRLMRAARLQWPVREGMGVYWRDAPADTTDVTYYDLTPYVEWEDGEATLDIVEGDPNRWNEHSQTSRADLVTVARETARAQAWNGYTPTWAGASGNPAIGNGSITGAFRRDGTTLHLRILITPGSTTTFGSGGYSLSLPPDMTAAAIQIVPVKLFTSATDWAGYAYTTLGGTTLTPVLPTSAADCRLAQWSPTSPATFANGGNLVLEGTIEIQP